MEVIWFDTLMSDQSLTLVHVLHIKYQSVGLSLQFETLVSAKDNVPYVYFFGLYSLL